MSDMSAVRPGQVGRVPAPSARIFTVGQHRVVLVTAKHDQVVLRAPEGRAVAGLEYLEAVTQVQHRRRLADPDREMWEAAELQWWWPRDRHEDPSNARVWCDAAGPCAAVLFSRWAPDRWECEVLADADFAPAWRYSADRSAQLQPARVEMEMIVEDDVETQRVAHDCGYVPSDETHLVSWLDPSEANAPGRPLAEGYAIAARAEAGTGPHPMAARNGAEVEDRLRQCSLYDPQLDLAVLAPDHAVAGYALFWADPVTRVGLVEPMRVEDAHAGRGLGTHLLAAGLRRLVDRGCTRLKVASEPSNQAAQRLYRGAGFAPSDRTRTWRYERAPGSS